MRAEWVTAWAGVGALVVAVLARWPGRYFWRLVRRTSQFLEDWFGEPARPGVPPRPGVMERLAAVEDQLKPNNGKSFYDHVTAAISSPQAPPSIHIHTDGKGDA